MCIWGISGNHSQPPQLVVQNDRSGRLLRFGAFVVTTIAATFFWQARSQFKYDPHVRTRIYTLLGVTFTSKAILAFTAVSIVAAIAAVFLLFSLYKDIRPIFRTMLPLG